MESLGMMVLTSLCPLDAEGQCLEMVVLGMHTQSFKMAA